ncbi:MAG: aldehyde dehydrogenase family protein [Planctomycetes bacterium]|nr:aldehyde dehydrogenase family protein [Planctomycetota bacterium]
MDAALAQWIDGARHGAGRAGTLEHLSLANPAAPKLVVPCAGEQEWQLALDAAERCLRALAFAPPSIQAPSFARLEEALHARDARFVEALVCDLGWTVSEAEREVDAALLEFSASLRGNTPDLPSARPLEGKRPGLLIAAPPAEAPLAPLLRALGASLWCGNSLLVAATPSAPRCAALLVDALEQSELHAGGVQVLYGRRTALAAILAARASRAVLETWARVSPSDGEARGLEALVPDARLLGEDRSATAAAFGPTCEPARDAARYVEELLARGGSGAEAPRALFVHDDRASEFADALVEELQAARASTTRAPLVEDGAVRGAELFVRRALEEGVAIPIGGQAEARGERRGAVWFEPTLLVNVARTSKTARARVGAPIAVLCRYASPSDLLARLEQARQAQVWIGPDLLFELAALGLRELAPFERGFGAPELREGEALCVIGARDRGREL